MRINTSYNFVAKHYPNETASIIAQVTSSKDFAANPDIWNWSYSFSLYGRIIYLEGDNHLEMSEYLLRRSIQDVYLCGSPVENSNNEAWEEIKDREPLLPLVEEYVKDNYDAILSGRDRVKQLKNSFEKLFEDNMKVNTSNDEKFSEFQKFGLKGVERTKIDVVEPDADKESIIRYKATFCGENIIVEDTSLDIEGEEVGANVKWLKNNLSAFIGKKAQFHVYVAIMRNNFVEIYHGMTEGMIGEKQGEGMGFDAYFYPEDSALSFAQEKPDIKNPRAKAIKNFVSGRYEKIAEPLHTWDGPWQSE